MDESWLNMIEMLIDQLEEDSQDTIELDGNLDYEEELATWQ